MRFLLVCNLGVVVVPDLVLERVFIVEDSINVEASLKVKIRYNCIVLVYCGLGNTTSSQHVIALICI